MTHTAAESAPRVLQGPRVCGGETEKMDWAGACTLRLDDGTLLGVRCSTTALLSVVERALAGRVVRGVDVPAFYSLRLGEPSRRTKDPLHYLYHGGRAVLATRDVDRLLEAVMRRIDSLGRTAPEGGNVLLNATAMTSPDGRAFLVPERIELVPRAVEKLLTANGFGLADVPQVEFDPITFEVVTTRPDLDIDWAALERDQLTDIGRTAVEPIIGYGRHKLSGWIVSVPDDQAGALRPAVAIAQGARLIASPFHNRAAQLLDDLNRVARAVPVTGVSYAATDGLIEQILAAI